ncbi:MAG: twin-arginine translocase TatA/TatE family subunit [Gemmatimonas sp.]|nr:twin-arginine translocase TatA/TatE family subunit [Gemmatimonas sp.]
MPIGGLGFGEMVLIFAVLLLLFGAKRLPELASGMGRGIRDFKRALSGVDDNSIQVNPQPQASIEPPPQPAQVQSASNETETKKEN